MRWSRSSARCPGPGIVQERHDWREVRERAKPEALQEQGGRAVEDRTAGTLVPANLLDEPSLGQGPKDSVRVDAPDAGDLVPGHALLVGHDGPGLPRGLGQPGVARAK